MRRALLAISLLALPACLVIEGPDREPLRNACDADGDGEASISCGGLDCDDEDASVAPDADEWFADDIDQDCDGTTSVQVDVFPLPARTEAVRLTWNPSLRSLGGVLVAPTGDAVAQDFDLDREFGGPVRLKRRSTYAPPTGELRSLRLPYENASIDLLFDDAGMHGWLPGGSEGERLWTAPGVGAANVATALTGDDPGAAWLLTCDGTSASLARLDLSEGSRDQAIPLERPADSCALLGHRDGQPIVLVSAEGQLERWILGEDGRFTDYLVLAPGFGDAEVRAVGGPEDGVLAFVDDGVLTVLDPDGRGLRLGEGQATEVFDVALHGTDAIVSWVDDEGLLWIASGPIEGPVDAIPVGDGFGAAGPIATGALDDELAVGIQDGDELVLFRARR